MKISVIVPSFNQMQYLDAALRSIIKQEYAEKEIIVMDGGSTDGSVDVIRKYESHLAYWRSGADGGQSRAIYDGFGIASGEIIGWLNSDDVLAPGALERVARAAGQSGSPDCLFYGGNEVIDSEGRVQEKFYPTWMIGCVARIIGPVLCQPGTFFGRSAYLRVGGVDPDLKYAMDLDLWLKFLLSGVKFVAIPEIQGKYRCHSMQKGRSHTWVQHSLDEHRKLALRYGIAPLGSARNRLARQVQRVLRLTTGRPHLTLAFRFFQHRRIRKFGVAFST